MPASKMGSLAIFYEMNVTSIFHYIDSFVKDYFNKVKIHIFTLIFNINLFYLVSLARLDLCTASSRADKNLDRSEA